MAIGKLATISALPERDTVRTLLVDLAVVATELVHAERPPYPAGSNTRARFEHWYQFGSRLFHLAIEVGMELGGQQAHRDDVALVVEALGDSGLLHQLCDAAEDVFGELDYEYGYVHVRHPWGELCTFVSALEFLRTLLGEHAQLAPDTTELVGLMSRWGDELYKEQEPPPGMPDEHWWWFAAEP